MLWRELLAINSTKSFFVFLDSGCVTSAQMCLVRILMTHFCWAVKRFWSWIWFRTNKPGRKTLMSLCGAWKTWSQSCSVSQCCERYNEILTVRASCFCCCNQWLYWFHLLCFEDLLLFFIWYDNKQNIFRFLAAGCTKPDWDRLQLWDWTNLRRFCVENERWDTVERFKSY